MLLRNQVVIRCLLYLLKDDLLSWTIPSASLTSPI